MFYNEQSYKPRFNVLWGSVIIIYFKQKIQEMKILFKNGTKVRINQTIANLFADAMKAGDRIVSVNAKGEDDVLLVVNLEDVTAII